MTFPDGLRAIAALLVIFPHSVGLFASWPTPSLPTRAMIHLADFGGRGVQIFFVLSGFVIAYSLRNAIVTRSYFSRFILRRSIRLDPPYWAAIALSCAVLAIRRSAARADLRLPSAGQLLSHLFYAQDILGYENINIVYWTLCIEVQFYLAFCLLLGVFQRLRRGRATGARDRTAFVVVYALSLAWPAGLLGSPAGLFLPLWYSFLLGSIVWWVIEGSLSPRVGHACILATLAIGAVKLQGSSLVVACTAGVLLLAAHRRGLDRWLDVSAIQSLGKISYSIYLVHVPVAEINMGLQTRFPVKSELMSFLFFANIVLMTIGCASLFHRMIEAPALLLSRRLKARDEGAGAVSPAAGPPRPMSVA